MTKPDSAQEKNTTPFPTSKDNPGRDDTLDSALEETFPASDPVSVTTSKTDIPTERRHEEAAKSPQKGQDKIPEEDTLDEAIEESFPASDPVSVTTKKPDDTQS